MHALKPSSRTAIQRFKALSPILPQALTLGAPASSASDEPRKPSRIKQSRGGKPKGDTLKRTTRKGKMSER